VLSWLIQLVIKITMRPSLLYSRKHAPSPFTSVRYPVIASPADVREDRQGSDRASGCLVSRLGIGQRRDSDRNRGQETRTKNPRRMGWPETHYFAMLPLPLKSQHSIFTLVAFPYFWMVERRALSAKPGGEEAAII
jgi:hypothetical protein